MPMWSVILLAWVAVSFGISAVWGLLVTVPRWGSAGRARASGVAGSESRRLLGARQ